MKAAYITRYGSPDVLEIGEQPVPIIGSHDLLVQVKAASINPLDYKIRNGLLKRVVNYPMPLILGQDCSGVVTAVGDKVTRFQAGDNIFARLDKARIGTLAEFAAVREVDAAVKPANLRHEEAAAVPLVGLTAWQVLCDHAGVKAGLRVLIQAGAGGVGSFAIQLARYLGAHVITTVNARNAALTKRLGADTVIDYRRQRIEDVCKDLDVVFDMNGGDDLLRAISLVKRGGHVITLGGMPTKEVMQAMGQPVFVQWFGAFANRKNTALAKKHGVHFAYHSMSASGVQLGAIAKLLESKVILPVIEKVFTLDQAREAIAHVEAGHTVGKVVVTP